MKFWVLISFMASIIVLWCSFIVGPVGVCWPVADLGFMYEFAMMKSSFPSATLTMISNYVLVIMSNFIPSLMKVVRAGEKPSGSRQFLRISFLLSFCIPWLNLLSPVIAL